MAVVQVEVTKHATSAGTDTIGLGRWNYIDAVDGDKKTANHVENIDWYSVCSMVTMLYHEKCQNMPPPLLKQFILKHIES